MPPVSPTPSHLSGQQAQNPMPPASGMPPAQPGKKRDGAGATVGIIIIVILMMFGALYFWGAYLNAQNAEQQPLPLIPGDVTVTTY